MKHDRYLSITGEPHEAAQQAYASGHFVEAIQIVHSYLELTARELIMLVGSVHFGARLKETWDLTDSFPLNDCLKILFIMNQISKGEFAQFSQLNTLRNKMIHRMFQDPYERPAPRISKRDYDRVFKHSLKMMDLFMEKSITKSAQ